MAGCTVGIDLGTSGVKVGVLDLSTCRLLAVAMRSYDSAPEQQSATLWEATQAAIREAVAAIDTGSVRAIGLSAQMHGAVLYDAGRAVIDPIINWQDQRCDVPLPRYGGRTTVEWMMSLLAGGDFYDLGINVLASGYLGATLFFIKENAPALFERVRSVGLPGDFLRGKLLGAFDHATDRTNACSTGIFNTRLNRWHSGVICALGLPDEILPVIHRTVEVAGQVPGAIARSLGLSSGTPVIYGGGDNQMSSLGSGLLSSESPLLVNIGTGAQISRVMSCYTRIPGIDTRSYFDDAFVLVGASMGGGRDYARLREEISTGGKGAISFQQLDSLASLAPVGTHGLEYRVSSRRDPRAKAGFMGRTEHYSVGCLARAVMEGVLLDLYALRPPDDGSGPGYMHGAGKALQRSRVWAQMVADLFGCPLKVTDFENAVWAAAVAAAIGAGEIRDWREAMSTIKPSQEMAPIAENTARYSDLIRGRLRERSS